MQGPADETSARGSSESPCRAVHPLNFPRHGHEPGACATGSDDFPRALVLLFFFYCIAELAVKPCPSSRSNMRAKSNGTAR